MNRGHAEARKIPYPSQAAGRRFVALILAFLGTGLAGIARGQVITEFSIPTADSRPAGIAAGSDGNLWFTENGDKQIGRISTAGVVTEFSVPMSTGGYLGIAAGPDGNLWFVELDANRIGRVTTAGEVSEFSIPTPDSQPAYIVAGPDGNLWFTENSADKIGRITTAGVVSEFSIPTVGSEPLGITAGPDGSLWFTEGGGNQIGRITTTGAITEFPVPTGSSFPLGITAGPDGNLWFAEGLANQIGRITPAGVVSEFPVPTAGSGPALIAAGPDGNIWFTEIDAGKIGRTTTGSCAVNAMTLCLNGGRFEVRGTWSVPPEGRSGVGTAVPLTGDTGYFWFFSSDNVELVIKVLDGQGLNGHFWVFYGALSNVQYTITVRDTVTGVVKTYENSYDSLASVADTSAFSPTGAVLEPSIASSKEIATRTAEELYGLYAALTETAAPKIVPVGCTPGETTLCLNQSRFQIAVDWDVPSQGRSGHGTAIPITDDTGYFWFFGDANVELVIKILDGRGINEHFWVFYGALSDVQYTIAVSDTQTQTFKTYTNPSGTLASVADTAAF